MIKVKVGKKQMNEVVGTIALALGALLVGALVGLFVSLKPLIEKAAKKLEEGTKKAEDAVSKSGLPDEKKKEFLNKLSAAKQDLQKTLTEVQEKAKNPKLAAQLAKRPSALIADKIGVVVNVMKEIKKSAGEDKALSAALDEATLSLRECYKIIKNIDLTAIIASKKDDKGMWKSVPGVRDAFEDKEGEWIDFASMVASNADPKASKIQGARVPVASA